MINKAAIPYFWSSKMVIAETDVQSAWAFERNLD